MSHEGKWAWAHEGGVLVLIVMFAFPVAGLLAKQSMTGFFLILAFLVLFQGVVSAQQALLPSPRVLVFFAVFAGYVVFNQIVLAKCEACGWKAVEKLALLGLVLWMLGDAVHRQTNLRAHWVMPALGLGLAVAAIVLLVELSADAPLHRAMNSLPAEAKVEPSRYNRGTSALVILAWPLAAMVWQHGRRWLDGLVVAFATLLAWYGESAAALLAGLAALTVFGLASAAPGAVRRFGGLVVAASMLAAPLLASRVLAWGKGWRESLPFSFFHRLEIWDHAAARILEAPFTGWGLGSYRYLPVSAAELAGYTAFDKPPTHPHNAALQLWVEGGLIGIGLALWLLWLTGCAIRDLPDRLQPFALAGLAAVLVLAGLSYGVWQGTWVAIIAIAAFCFQVLARTASPTIPEESGRGALPS